ncbi:V-type ATP synthase subunit E [Methanohalophilus sp.]|uniref:V-type ATP synthase subunit E n=1 Tax=Methanohalophilus sp. TaxID=1966352 RepID=UPI0026157ADC|nr:V-type ATP synthase subunit E [Methanohalophilus sp.]MDK2892714.1 V/A-type H+/Na+-transporting ATPase subunit [Methanohalophilus sp.]
MGLETVINDIMEVAQAEVAKMDAEAETEVSRILEDAKEEAKRIKGNILAKTENDIEKMRNQAISSANLEVKRRMLNARKELLEKVYSKAADSIASLTPSKNEELLKAIIDQYQENGTKIYSNKDSEELVKKLSTLEYAGNINCIGGVVIENDDGTVRFDYTYDSILNDVNERSLKQISDILFG